jgi:hypothetical protein
MKHILIKWRNNIYEPFKFFTQIPIEMVKRYIGPISPYQGQEIKFKIIDNIPEEFQEVFGKDKQITLIEMTEHFYLIERDTLFIYRPNFPAALLTTENITDFQIGNENWQPISNATFYNQYCIVTQNPKAFCVVGGQNQAIRFVNQAEIENFEEVKIEDFLQLIAVKNYILT